jgi:hypothetical protein
VNSALSAEEHLCDSLPLCRHSDVRIALQHRAAHVPHQTGTVDSDAPFIRRLHDLGHTFATRLAETVSRKYN